MTDLSNFAAIIPAAGMSSRMKDFKPLLKLGYETVIEKVISTFKIAGIKDIIVVVGHQMQQLTSALKDKNVHLVENHDYKEGMYSSVRTGVVQLQSHHRAFFLLPGDIPLVRPQTLARLAREYGEKTEHIIYPVFQGKHGHPPLIPTDVAPDIMNWNGEGGLKALLNSKAFPFVELPVADRYILQDMDYHEDYLAVLKNSRRHDILTTAECDYIRSVIHPVAERVRVHCDKVAMVAKHIGQALTAKDVDLDLDIIEAGAMLHDLAKGQKDHAVMGEKLIREMGFPTIAKVVGAHTDLSVDPYSAITETEIVHLADKCVKGDRIIPIEQRFQEPLARWGHDPIAMKHITRRREAAFKLKEKVEAILETSLEKVLG